jgi:hypothetical protein
MSQEKYIGMDVHQATISVAVMDGKGKPTELIRLPQFPDELRILLQSSWDQFRKKLCPCRPKKYQLAPVPTPT